VRTCSGPRARRGTASAATCFGATSPITSRCAGSKENGHTSVFRNPANNSNGNTFDFQGRQISCEHLTRRVTRYEPNGTVTVLADKFGGKEFNAPNDVVVHPNGDIWFTDPGYGGLMNYEAPASPAPRCSRTKRRPFT
jgi:sugar lactone lactonase YvrE